jgi:hypothetical protein
MLVIDGCSTGVVVVVAFFTRGPASHACVYACVCVSVCVYARVSACMHACMGVHVSVGVVYLCMCFYVCVCMSTHVYTYSYIPVDLARRSKHGGCVGVGTCAARAGGSCAAATAGSARLRSSVRTDVVRMSGVFGWAERCPDAAATKATATAQESERTDSRKGGTPDRSGAAPRRGSQIAEPRWERGS